MHIPAHQRHTPKSEHDIWLSLSNLNTILSNIHFQDKLSSSSTSVQAGNTELYKAIENIINYINNK